MTEPVFAILAFFAVKFASSIADYQGQTFSRALIFLAASPITGMSLSRVGVAVMLHERVRQGALPARWADLASSLAGLGEKDMEAIAREWGLTAGLTSSDPTRAIIVFGKADVARESGVYVLRRNGTIEWLPADEWTRTLATPSEFWGTDNADVIEELRQRVRLPWPYDALALWGNMNWSLIWQRYESPDAAVRRETVASLHLIAGGAATDAGKELAFLERAITDADPDVRLAVVARLVALGGEPVARLLPGLLADPDLRVRRQASVAIRDLRNARP